MFGITRIPALLLAFVTLAGCETANGPPTQLPEATGTARPALTSATAMPTPTRAPQPSATSPAAQPSTAAQASVSPGPTGILQPRATNPPGVVGPPSGPGPVFTPSASPRPSPTQVLPPVLFPTWWSQAMQTGCTDKVAVSFGSPPLRMVDIVNIGPYGLMVASHVIPSDHQEYMFPQRGPTPTYDVLSVADGEIVGVSVRSVSVDTGKPSVSQYHVTVRHSCSIITQYDLLDEMEPGIAAQLDSMRRGTPIPVKEGQVIGRTGASSQGMDLWVADLRTLAPGYAVQAHYTAEAWRLYAIEPFSLFSEPLRAQMRAKSIRKAEPKGGLADTDIDGRLVGGWFVEGTNGYAGRSQADFFKTHLAITYHAYDPTGIIVSMGNYDGRARQFAVKGNAPNPAQISESSGPVKYELSNWTYYVGDSNKGWDYKSIEDLRVRPFGEVLGTLLVQVLPDRRLRVEAFPGKLASQVDAFTAASVIYER